MNYSWRRARFLAMIIAGALLPFIAFSGSSPTAKRMQHVFLVLVSGLIFFQLSLFIRSILSDRKEKLLVTRVQGQSPQSLVGLLLSRTVGESSVAYCFLFASLFVSAYLSALELVHMRLEVFLFISGLLVANFVGQKILKYRIKKSLFGTNESEAREIISFILDKTNWSDFTSRGGGKGIFPESAEELINSSEALSDAKV